MMVNRTRFYLATALMILFSFVAVAMAQTGAGLTTPDMPEKMKVAIEASLQDPELAAKTMEVINPEDAPGFLGIPGAPDPSLILGLLWAIWVGWIFSTVGPLAGLCPECGISRFSVWPIMPNPLARATRSTT
jgi:hypothetical protein